MNAGGATDRVEADDLDAVRSRPPILSWIHEETSGWRQILARDVEPALGLGRHAPRRLDRPELPARPREEEMDLRESAEAQFDRALLDLARLLRFGACSYPRSAKHVIVGP
jgi:hypothetical protein